MKRIGDNFAAESFGVKLFKMKRPKQNMWMGPRLAAQQIFTIFYAMVVSLFISTDFNVDLECRVKLLDRQLNTEGWLGKTYVKLLLKQKFDRSLTEL